MQNQSLVGISTINGPFSVATLTYHKLPKGKSPSFLGDARAGHGAAATSPPPTPPPTPPRQRQRSPRWHAGPREGPPGRDSKVRWIGLNENQDTIAFFPLNQKVFMRNDSLNHPTMDWLEGKSTGTMDVPI